MTRAPSTVSQAPPPPARQPLDALDKACLAATRAPWSSFAPTWKLDLSAAPSPELLQRALDWAVARTPWVAASVIDGAWVVPAAPRVVLSAATSEQAVLDRFIDVAREPVLEVALLRHDAGATLLFHQHHAVADGRAFLEFLGEFFDALRAAEQGAQRSPLHADVVPRRRQREVVTHRGVARLLAFIGGAFVSLSELAMAVLRPVKPLPSNVGTDYSGSNQTLHHFVPLARLEAWRATRERIGLSTNDLLAGALLRALSVWSGTPGHTHTLLFPIDVRPREGFRSFANHLSNLQLRWRSDQRSALEHAHHVRQQSAGQLRARAPWRRVLFDALIASLTPLPTLQRALLDDRRLVTTFSFSNLLPLGVPGADASGRWRTAACTVERVRITTPCVPPQAVNLTVARSGDAACFNFNFKATAIDEARVAQLRDHFCAALDELDASLASPQSG